MASRPARVGDIVMHIELPAAIPEENRAALMAVASHCTVHNALTTPPKISIDLACAQSVAA
jgi:putative redox protein